MGGLLAHTLVSDCGNPLWNAFANKPLGTLSLQPAETMRELADEYPGILTPYFVRIYTRGGPTSLFSLAPNPLLDSLPALPIRVPFHSIIGNRGVDDGPESSDGLSFRARAPARPRARDLLEPAYRFCSILQK
jgi:hypothetical protein